MTIIRLLLYEETIKDAVYADDLPLRSNTPERTKSLQYSLDRASDSIGLSEMEINQRPYVLNKKEQSPR